MGKPVVAAAWGGPLDYVNAETGVLIDPQTPEAFARDLAAALERLAGDPALRRSMGAAGRRRIEREFDWRVKIDRMLSYYDAVLGGQGVPLALVEERIA
jgi:glycosyltransferase involved in cell wall biosynthesis